MPEVGDERTWFCGPSENGGKALLAEALAEPSCGEICPLATLTLPKSSGPPLGAIRRLDLINSVPAPNVGRTANLLLPSVTSQIQPEDVIPVAAAENVDWNCSMLPNCWRMELPRLTFMRCSWFVSVGF